MLNLTSMMSPAEMTQHIVAEANPAGFIPPLPLAGNQKSKIKNQNSLQLCPLVSCIRLPLGRISLTPVVHVWLQPANGTPPIILGTYIEN